jgi:hypothetical protein
MSEHFTLKGMTPKMQLKQLSAQWLEQNDRGPHILSSEETPAVPYMPFRFLPALQYFDTVNRMREGIVLLKGTICSAVNVLETLNAPITGGGPTDNGNQEVWNNGQAWPLFQDRLGAPVSSTLEYSVNGYGSDIHSLLVPATGPAYAAMTDVDYTATVYDSDMGRLRPDGTLMVAGDVLEIPVNIPVGIVMDDIYVDYRGQFLNYHTEGKLLTNLYKQAEIVYPYLDLSALLDSRNAYFAANVVWNNPAPGETEIKPTLDKKFRYFWGYATTLTVGETTYTQNMIDGAKIISDEHGNPTVYTREYANIQAPAATELLHDIDWVKTQIIGTLDGLNPKQPHSLNDLTDTMLGSGMTGTDTAGIEAELFWFVYWVMALANPSATIGREDIKTACRKGHFGFATIWLNVR